MLSRQNIDIEEIFQSMLGGFCLSTGKELGHIPLAPSLFSRLSSLYGRLQNPVLLVLSSKTGRFRRPSKGLLELECFTDFERILALMRFLCDNLS